LQTAVVASGAIPTIAAGSALNTGGSETGANSVGTQDLANCFKSLNPFYRRNAKFYMAPSTLDTLMGLVSRQGTEVVNFRKGFGKGDDVPQILGRDVALCPSLGQLGASANIIFFGDPAYFITRLARNSAYIQRINQSTQAVTYGLVLFQSYLRADSNLLAPNSQALPFQFIQCHS
jgi:HK97 family phage major capsid protein